MLSHERSQAAGINSQSRMEDSFSSSAVFTLQLLNLMFDSFLHMSGIRCLFFFSAGVKRKRLHEQFFCS